jgi:c-di-GMP-related signal transduction protein
VPRVLPAPGAGRGEAMDVFVTRQPIFDRFRRTYGYELLFRTDTDNQFPDLNPDRASLKVIDTAFFLPGLESITGGKRAFVNFTRDTLVKGYATLIPAESIVVKVLEDVPPDAEVLDACRTLRKAGHLIALDDVVLGSWFDELVEVADIITVDFSRCRGGERRQIIRDHRPLGLKMLADKVETPDDSVQAFEAGYDYFQGYFFSRPTIVGGKRVPVSKLNVLQLLREIHRPETDVRQIEEIIKREVALPLKLLTYINSAGFGFKRRIISVAQALLILGESGVRKWASVAALSDMGCDKPFELVVTSVVRARFCESLAAKVGLGARAEDAFLMGLFSMIDALLGLPLTEAVDRLPVADDVRSALLGGDSGLRRVYDLVLAYERGRWDRVSEVSAALSLDEGAIREVYLDAVEWGNSTTPNDTRP